MNCPSIVARLRPVLLLLAIAVAPHARAAVVFDLYISDDQGLNRYNSQSSNLTTIVPESAEAFAFTGVAIGPNGNLFAAASGAAGSQIWQYDRETGAPVGPGPFVFYQGTPPTPDPHDVIIPAGIAFSPTNGQLYVADQGVHNVHVYDANGDSVGSLTDDTLVQPPDVAFDVAGNLYVANPGFANVLTSPAGTAPLEEHVAFGTLTNPLSLTVGPDARLYVVDASSGQILATTPTARSTRSSSTTRPFNPPTLSSDPTACFTPSDSTSTWARASCAASTRMAQTPAT